MVSISMPSLSQDVAPEAECGDAFKRSDANNDGFLTHTEIPKARDMPADLAKAKLVGRPEFMAACVKLVQAKLAEKAVASTPPAESPQDPAPPSK
jgi:hypothetical protein